MADVRISAKSTLASLNRWIEVISSNITGANIYGYKGTRISFGDTLVDVLRTGTGQTTAGGLNPIQIASGGISIGSTSTDFRQGSIVQTGNHDNLAIQGNAFFVTADSAGKIMYSRNGEFHFDDRGNLVTADGNYVLGVFDLNKKLDNIVNSTDNDDAEFTHVADVTADDPNGNGPGTAGVLNGAGATITDLSDGAGGAAGILIGGNPFAGAFTPASTTTANLRFFMDDPNAAGWQDRAIFTQAMTGTGQLEVGAGNTDGTFTLLGLDTTGNAVTVSITLNSVNNTSSNTAYDNARLMADAINAQSYLTGVGASIIRDKNNPETAVSLVLGHVERTLTEDYVSFANYDDVTQSVSEADVGLVKVATDSKGNVYHRVNIKTLTAAAPDYSPRAGDSFTFDATGQLINTSRGKDAATAPPFYTGVHVAINKFSNNDGLLKVRGSSVFTYTDAAGEIYTGYAGMDTGARIQSALGRQTSGSTTIGAENIMITQSLEGSNTSITEMLPELTVAQKTFTSNTKVINVGNTIVDDLNGLIR